MNQFNPWLLLILVVLAVGVWALTRKSKDESEAGVQLDQHDSDIFGDEAAPPAAGGREKPQDTGGGVPPKQNP